MLRPSMRGSRHRVCACACACQTIHETARNAILAFIEECASDFKGKANLANVELEYQNLLRQGAERDGSPRQRATLCDGLGCPIRTSAGVQFPPKAPASKTNDTSNAAAEMERREREELELALALSISETEAKKVHSRTTTQPRAHALD